MLEGGTMEPAIIDLTTRVMAVLLLFVTKGTEEFASKMGDATFEKVQTIFATLKAKWSGDQEATDTLTKFVEKPGRYKLVLEDILQEKLGEDKALSTTLSQLLKDMGPTLEIVQTMDEAHGITGLKARQIRSGTMKVTQDMKAAEDTTGIDADTIG